jgi:hypothetical protein
MSACEISGRSRPEWIPLNAWDIYLLVLTRGGYDNERKSRALETLFTDESLIEVWKSMARLDLSLNGWDYLIRAMIGCLSYAPPCQRATRDNPDEKIRILERQKKVDVLLTKAAKAADTLANLLRELEKNGGHDPVEAYSGIQLIHSSMPKGSLAHAYSKKPFMIFSRSLSVDETYCFPSPCEMIETLSKNMKSFPKYKKYFRHHTWLSHGQSSWKDYVRMLQNEFDTCRTCFGDAPRFTDAEWTCLLQALVNESLILQTVAKGLKEL